MTEINTKTIALVTGGDKGIGEAIVKSMSMLVDMVVFTYNSDIESAQAVQLNVSNSVSFQCDLKNFESVKNLIREIETNYGQVSILINNAGYDSDSTLLKMSEDSWHDVIDVNLNSLYYLTKGVLGGMIDSEWGRIINITSIAEATGAFGKSNYSASKAGIVGLTKSIALETASKNVTVNAIAPGAINTSMYQRIPEKYKKMIVNGIPMRRIGRPEDIANLVAFLISDGASYITGQTIHVNGGSYLC